LLPPAASVVSASIFSVVVVPQTAIHSSPLQVQSGDSVDASARTRSAGTVVDDESSSQNQKPWSRTLLGETHRSIGAALELEVGLVSVDATNGC
jgi:hypothetical protein